MSIMFYPGNLESMVVFLFWRASSQKTCVCVCAPTKSWDLTYHT